MKDLNLASTLKNRMALVRPDKTFDGGIQPLVLDGMWSGLITDVDPVEKDGVVVDYVLKIKLSFGSARQERWFHTLYSSANWKLRFPGKGEG